MDEISSRVFLVRAKAFLSDHKSHSLFSSLGTVIEALMNYCDTNHDNEHASVDCLASHLRAIRHYVKIKEGKSLYLRSIHSSELDRLIEEGEKILGDVQFCWGGELQPPAKATIVARQDDTARERKLEQEQLFLDDNKLFHNLLRSIWLYALERRFESKTLFISYAWPIGNVHEEAWTKAFVEKLAYHLVSAGFQVYLDDIQGGAGFPLDEFMSKLKKCDHVLLISSRTMKEKLKRDESGVNQEKRKILEHLEKQDKGFRERIVIPVLLNFSNYCDPLFASLAEVPMCVDGYLGSLCKLLPRLFGDSKEKFEKWFDVQLKREQVKLFEGVPQFLEKGILREKLLSEVDLRLKADQVVVISGEEGVGKTKLAVDYCYSEEAKRYGQIYWLENGANVIPEIPEGSLVVLNDVENLRECIKGLSLWGNVSLLVTTRQGHVVLRYVKVSEFSREEAIQCVEMFLWNIDVHKPEWITVLVDYVGFNPRRLREGLDYINRNKLNIPRYLRLQGQQGLDEAIEKIEILEPELSRGNKEENKSNSKDDKGKEEAFTSDGLVFNPSEQIRPWNLPMRNPNFTGREGLLATLESLLTFQALGNLKPVVIIPCDGMGEVGKTELAKEFAHRYRSHYRFVIWISAGSEEQVRSAYFQLGQDLKILPEKVSSEEAIKIVKDYLASRPGNLLIFDGATGDVKPFAPATGCSVLVTSRVKHDWVENSISVPVFDPKEAFDYVKKILGERAGDSEEAIYELCKTMGHLPLALAQATAYIWVQKMSIEGYLELYRQTPVSILNAEIMPAFDQHIPVYVTFELAMKAVSQESAYAAEILNICSCMHHDVIPGFIFDLAEEALGLLCQYSLISMSPLYKFSVHRLIQDVAQLRLSGKDKEIYVDAVFNLLIKFFPFGEEKAKLADISVKRVLFPHLEVLLLNALLPKIEKEINEVRLIILLDYLRDAYGTFSDARRMCQIFERVLEIQKLRYSPQHPVIGAILITLSDAYINLGDWDKGRELADCAMITVKEHFGVSSLEAAEGVATLARVQGYFGDYDKACELLEQTLVAQEAYDDCSLKVARTLVVLSAFYCMLGCAHKGRELAERALSIQEKYFDAPNHVIARTWVALGTACLALDDVQRGCELFSQALLIYERHYGACHIETFGVLSLLNGVRLYEDLADARRNCELFERVLAVQEEHYGSKSQNIIVACTLTHLGEAYVNLGEVQKGCDLLERAYSIISEHYKSTPNHIMLGGILTALGKARLFLCDVSKACELLSRALPIVEQYFKDMPNYPDVVLVLALLGEAYLISENTQEGCVLLERALPGLKRWYESTPNHPKFAGILGRMGKAYLKLNDTNKASDFLRQALEMKRGHYGATHVEVAKALYELGQVYVVLRELDKGREILEQALHITESCHEPDQSILAKIGESLAYIQKLLDERREKWELQERKLTAEEVRETAKVSVALAKEHFAKGKIGDSLQALGRMCDLLLLRMEGEEAANGHHKVACMCELSGDIDLAEHHFLKALDHKPVVSIYCDYGAFLFRRHRFEEAANVFLLVFSNTEDNTELKYGEFELERLDDFLRNEIRENGEIVINSTMIAYYWIIRCYHQLHEESDCEVYLKAFHNTVKGLSKKLYWRLLGETYKCIGKYDEAEECQAFALSLEVEKVSDATIAAQIGLLPAVAVRQNINNNNNENDFSIPSSLSPGAFSLTKKK